MSKKGSYIGGHTLVYTKVPTKISVKKNKKKSLFGYKELVKQDDDKIIKHFKEVIERNNRRIKKHLKANKNQKERVGEKLGRLISGSIRGKKIAILGLAFKANTDDVRESSSIDLIKFILNEGGFVNAYDPIANESMEKIFNDIHYSDNVYDAIDGVDALVIMTEWNEFRALDLNRIKKSMRNNYVLDTRNVMNMKDLSDLGFVYDNIGRIKI